MSLLEQLKKRQSDIGTNVLSIKSQKVRPSLLFDPKDAAKIDLDALYLLAMNGLDQLKRIEARVKPFQATLFSPNSKEYTRELQTKAMNAKLDEEIDTLVALLAPYFLLKPTHKVLEYMIRKYSIHEFNKNSLLKYFLPYHQSLIFVRLLKIISLQGFWEFLKPIKEVGVPLSRHTLVERIIQDRNLLLVLLDLVKESVSSRTSYKTLLSFYTACILEVISKHRISDSFLREIWKYLIHGLGSLDENYQLVSSMILVSLSWKTSIKTELIRSALDTLFAHTLPHLHKDTLMTLIIILQNATQNSALMSMDSQAGSQVKYNIDPLLDNLWSEEAIDVFLSWNDSQSILETLHNSEFDLTIFTQYFLLKLSKTFHISTRSDYLIRFCTLLRNNSDQIHAVIVSLLKQYNSIISNTNNSGENVNTMDVDKKMDSESPKSYETENQLNFNSDKIYTNNNQLISRNNEKLETQLDSFSNSLLILLKILEEKYPDQVDRGVEIMLQTHSDETAWTVLFENSRHHPVVIDGKKFTLQLCLRQNNSTVKIFALKQLLKFKDNPKVSKLIEENILEHLKSEDADLVLNALRLKRIRFSNPFSFLEALELILNNWNSQERLEESRKDEVCKYAFKFLVKLSLNYEKSSHLTIDDAIKNSEYKSENFTSSENDTLMSDQSDSNDLKNHEHVFERLKFWILSFLLNPDFSKIAITSASLFQHKYPQFHLFKYIKNNSKIPTIIECISKSLVEQIATDIHSFETTEKAFWLGFIRNPITHWLSYPILQSSLIQSNEIESFSNIVKLFLPFLKIDFEDIFMSTSDLDIYSNVNGMNPRSPISHKRKLSENPEKILNSTKLEKSGYLAEILLDVIHKFSVFSTEFPQKLNSPQKSQICSRNSLKIITDSELVNLLYTIFSLVASSAYLEHFEQHIDAILKLLDTDHLVLKFLQLSWISTEPLILPVVIIRALNILNTRIKNSRQFSIDFIENIPTLLIPLSHVDSTVRSAALSICKSFCSHIKSHPLKKLNSKYLLLIRLLDRISLLNSIDVSIDVISQFLDEILNQDGVFSCQEKAQLLECVINQALQLPVTYGKYRILYLLRSTVLGTKLKLLAPLFGEVLQRLNLISKIKCEKEASNLIESKFTAKVETPRGLISREKTQSLCTDNNSPLKMIEYPVVDVDDDDGGDYDELLTQVLIGHWCKDTLVLVNEDPSLFELLIKCLKHPYESSNQWSVRKSTLKILNQDFFNSLRRDQQETLFEHICILMLYSDNKTKEEAQKVLKSLSINHEILVSQLNQIYEHTRFQESDDNINLPLKRFKSSSNTNESQTVDNDSSNKEWVGRLVVILEMFQYKTYDTVINGTHLVSVLFKLLSSSIDVDASLHSDPASEYIEQLIFTTLISICSAIFEGLKFEKQFRHISNNNAIIQNSELLKNAVLPNSPHRLILEKSDLISLESAFNVDGLIKSIRARSNPTLHNNALLLLSHIARIYPGKVLANISSIFAFVGSVTERSDDTYTFHVIEKTINSVIPALLNHSSAIEGRVSASALLELFVTRLEIIPQHRRLMLFTHILTKILKNGYLPLVLALILRKQYLNQDSTGPISTPVNTDTTVSFDSLTSIQFALTLFHKLSPYQCISAFIYLFYWFMGMDNKLQNSPLSSGTIGKLSPSTKQSLHLEYVQFVLSYFNSRTLITQLVDLSPEESHQMQKLYITFFQVLLMFSRKITPKSQSEDAIINIVYKILDNVNELMTIETFFLVIKSLMKQDDITIKNRALCLFNEKIKSMFSGTNVSDQNITCDSETIEKIIEFTKFIFNLLQNDDHSSETVYFLNIQTAALGVEIIGRLFGHMESLQESMIQLLNVIAKILVSLLPLRAWESLTSTSETHTYSRDLVLKNLSSQDLEINERESVGENDGSVKVQASLIIALGTICASMGDRVLPVLNTIFPIMLSTLRSSIASGNSQGLLEKASLTAIIAVVKQIPHFLSPYWTELFTLMLVELQEVSCLVIEVLQTIAKNVHIRLLIETFDKTLNTLYSNHPKKLSTSKLVSRLKSLCQIAGIACSNMDRSAVQLHHRALFDFYLLCFSYPSIYLERTHEDQQSEALPTLEVIQTVIDFVLESFSEFLLKLNENLFKPLFLLLVDWAEVYWSNQVQETKEKLNLMWNPRIEIFYRIVILLTETLKAIFVPYFETFFEYSLNAILEPISKIKKNESILKQKKIWSSQWFLPAKATAENVLNSISTIVLQCLTKLFLYEKSGNFTKEKFDSAMPIIVNQLDTVVISDYKLRASTAIIPCIAQLAVCSKEVLWKSITHCVLLKAQHTHPQVRVSAIMVLHEFYNLLSNSYLQYLPDSIQTLSELLEDSNANVEIQVLELIRKIEEVMGKEGSVMSLLSK